MPLRHEEEISNPQAKQILQQQLGHTGEIVKRIFNPQVGKYDVAASVGPAYGSKREDTVDALTLILTQAPALTGIIGDLLLGAMDFDKAQEAAQRLRRMVPPQALGTGPTPQEQQLTQQVQTLTVALSKSLQRQGKDVLKLVGKDQQRDINVYKAETDRFKALADSLPMDQQGLVAVIEQLVEESLKTRLGPIIDSNANDIDETPNDSEQQEQGEESPPVQGAQKAPDGEWYLTDPSRKGKYLRIEPLARQYNGVG